ncbi:MAG: hypothetical protein FJ149_08440 [Euryarchaeota archaeon]|nr:hypothetical protein [Euryarchaeota archaeon]
MAGFEALFATRKRKLIVGAVVAVLVVAGIGLMFPGPQPVTARLPTFVLPTDYIVAVEEPRTEFEMAFIACLAPVINHNGYHPFFILEDGRLDAHSLWTVRNSDLGNLPVLLFSNSSDTESSLSAQVPRVTRLNLTRATLQDFAGFEGRITVRDYREALWVSGLAAARNFTVALGKPTYKTQEQVWREMDRLGLPASYVVVANPGDWSERFFDDEVNARALSAVAAEMAAFHRAYVVTDIRPSTEPLVDMAGDQELIDLNANCTGLLATLRNISAEYGPVENIAIVGSHGAVPQFKLPDLSQSEADGDVASDCIYGFLDPDDSTIDAAVGRIVNYNVQGAANQLVRTYCYERMTRSVDVKYSDGSTKTRVWTQHGSSFNGYEITHKRMQATPGYYWCRDAEDEGLSYEYYGPTGIGVGIKTSQTVKENDFDPILQSSGLMAYRGHGSWHGSLYSLRAPAGAYLYPGQVEAADARELFMPPQIALFAACENGKIWGKSFSGGETTWERMFAPSYLYGGAIALVGATEVSYSDLGQDFPATVGHFTGDHDWDKNNAMYAFFWDGILNHEEEHGTLGQAFMWMVQRYMNNHNGVTPMKQADTTGDGADWKQVAMYVLYGDPAFRCGLTKPGANDRDEWHNGPGDQ